MCCFPNVDVRLEAVEFTAEVLIVVAAACGPPPRCPGCRARARRVGVCVIFHTALDLMNVIRELKSEGWQITGEDLALISSYLTGHIMRFGTYTTELTVCPDVFAPHLDVEFEVEEAASRGVRSSHPGLPGLAPGTSAKRPGRFSLGRSATRPHCPLA